MSPSAALEAALSTALTSVLSTDVRVTRLRPVGGGSLDTPPGWRPTDACDGPWAQSPINNTAVAETSAGAFFVKSREGATAAEFEAERDGLEALRAADCGLYVPRIVALVSRPAMLVLEHLPPGRPATDYDLRLGRGLATLHLATTDRGFGFARDNFCGATPQANGFLPAWIPFYRERRLRPLVERLSRAGALDTDDRRVFDRLLDRLEALLAAPDEPPALIHGDLWSGNVHCMADGRPALVDPAAYYGHREAELGMMVLFGGFSERVFEAYEAVRPLAPGWRARLPLYTLYHVLNHAVLFGGGYVRQAVGIARRFG